MADLSHSRGENTYTARRGARGGSATAEPGLPVEQFTCDLQVAGMRGGLLDHVQDDPADIRDLPDVLRVRVKAEPARSRGQRGDGEDLIGSLALVAVAGDEVSTGPVAREGGLGIVGAFVLVPAFALAPGFPVPGFPRRRFLPDARGHLLEPVVLDAA